MSADTVMVSIGIDQIKALGGERMLLPEITNSSELAILLDLTKVTTSMNESEIWGIDYCREVDMTNKKPHFKSEPTRMALPVIEGRMAHAFTSKAKEYISGEGRSAVWSANFDLSRNYSELVQFHMPKDEIKKEAQSRISKQRIGIRDIVGQTNERTMMAVQIPAGVCCGNKVPTILLPYFDNNETLNPEAQKVWICIANSFVFDWISRKFVTTSMNKFIIEILRMPDKIVPDSKEWDELVQLYDKLEAEEFMSLAWGKLRAEIDAVVALSYQLNIKKMEQILESFPLIDKKERPIHDEKRSTVTMDSILSAMGSKESRERCEKAFELGAIPYRPDGLISKQRTQSFSHSA